MQLTPEGLANRFKVITALFSYIDLIRKRGVPRFLPSELAALSDLGWRFQDKKEPGSLVPALAASMQEYDPEFVLRCSVWGGGGVLMIAHVVVIDHGPQLPCNACVCVHVCVRR